MSHLSEFPNQEDYEAAKYDLDYPNVSLIGNSTLIYSAISPHDYSLNYLTLEILENGTIGWIAAQAEAAKTIQYSINDGEWTNITSTTAGVTINVQSGDKVRFKGENDGYATSNTSYSGFGNIGTASFDVQGNIMSLIYGDDFVGKKTLPSTYTFCCLFDTANVVSAENLVLPATIMTQHCYRALFANDNNLTKAPEFPATTLASNCYRYTFNMCSLLERGPVLPAATLVDSCYYGLFNGCTNLNYIKCLATDNSASHCTQSWTASVGRVGTFVKHTNMNSWSSGTSGIPTGWTVKSLSN